MRRRIFLSLALMFPAFGARAWFPRGAASGLIVMQWDDATTLQWDDGTTAQW